MKHSFIINAGANTGNFDIINTAQTIQETERRQAGPDKIGGGHWGIKKRHTIKLIVLNYTKEVEIQLS